jgi:integrating conjugative element protein (TIGR03752 family)
MGGFATGDLGLECARGYVTNMTFIFEDGTIRQIGEASVNGQDGDVLAVLTDTSGTECISGDVKTNLREMVGTSTLLAGLEAAAQGAVASQTTTTSNSNGTSSSAVTGSSGAVIGGTAIAGAVTDGKRWLDERWNQTFDAILVEIGESIQIEMKKQIAIDYEPEGRRVRHMDGEELENIMYGGVYE